MCSENVKEGIVSSSSCWMRKVRECEGMFSFTKKVIIDHSKERYYQLSRGVLQIRRERRVDVEPKQRQKA